MLIFPGRSALTSHTHVALSFLERTLRRELRTPHSNTRATQPHSNLSARTQWALRLTRPDSTPTAQDLGAEWTRLRACHKIQGSSVRVHELALKELLASAADRFNIRFLIIWTGVAADYDAESHQGNGDQEHDRFPREAPGAGRATRPGPHHRPPRSPQVEGDGTVSRTVLRVG
ncbi:hypothetical protein [Streptomyces osmaniensis]|uniref:Transposase n=1 Tax=Streptomyces osmaniensis TaxID=593134 RepID=A0ABP6WIZ2_9ACTN